MGNALTQGIAVKTGLQEHFSWRSTAASAIGAGIGAMVGSALQNTDFGNTLGSPGIKAIEGGVRSVVTGYADAKLRHQKVSGTQLALAGFQGALSSGLAKWDEEQRAQAKLDAALGFKLGARNGGGLFSNKTDAAGLGQPGESFSLSLGTTDRGADAFGETFSLPTVSLRGTVLETDLFGLAGIEGFEASMTRLGSGNSLRLGGAMMGDTNSSYDVGRNAGGESNESTPSDNRTLLNAVNQATEPGRYTSREGYAYTLKKGDTYSRLSGDDLPPASE